MGLFWGVGVIAALVVANAALAAYARRSLVPLLIELCLYVVWAVLAVHFASRNGAFSPALTVLIIVLAVGLVSRLRVGKHVSRLLGIENALDMSPLGQAFSARLGIAKARMAERERKAKELGISVMDVLEMECTQKNPKH